MFDLIHMLQGVGAKEQTALSAWPRAWQAITFREVVVDSRETVPDALFVALSGEQTDGHRFVQDAAERGARGALVRRGALDDPTTGSLYTALQHGEQPVLTAPWVLLDTVSGVYPTSADPHSFWLVAVDDPMAALHQLARYHRQQHAATVIGITGSVGKTSTKEVIAALLSRQFATLKSKRSYNSEATLPTVLLQLTPEHQVAVLEMGMWAAGELRKLADLARPHIGVVTNVGPSHMERLGSIEAIAQAKAELIESLPADGVAVLNADDERVRAMARLTSARVITYGLQPTADVWADALVSRGLEGMRFRVHYQDVASDVFVPLPGKHHVSTVLAAAAVGLTLGMSWDAIWHGLQQPLPTNRLQVVTGLAGSQILDDTYNAAPASVLAALNIINELPGRRIAVLGDMLELGPVEEEAHHSVGQRAAEVVHNLVCVGPRARWIGDAAAQHGMGPEVIHCVETNQDAIAVLHTLLHPNHTAPDTETHILIKGSRGVAMEQIVAALRRPEREE
ncbi:MAG: UDP-N-acetylmuramoyl-tripeptide--D-alanyl-D-alanine ligase [Chloroflexaceae bacterium]|nr:UDP-N-acetylmuramoyl-tripeptide--D-alanyl-D-alanine ligase [Chloroflexaceae bacterium]